MSLHAKAIAPVPEQTARIAQAAFPKGNPYLQMRNEFGSFFEDEQFADLFPTRGQPAQSPWRLALATILQFAEGLSDHQAAEAVRSRIDWKYALSLELDDAGFDSSVLCEFRARLLCGEAEARLFETLLTRFRERGLVKARGRQRTDSTHVLAAIRALNRFELVTETLRHALDVLALAAPDWLRAHAHPDWAERYGRRAFKDRLPAKTEDRIVWAKTVGADGSALLSAVFAVDAPAELREVPAIEVLRRVWVQNYCQSVQGTERSIRWREEDIPPSTQFLSSPCDTEAHLAKKGSNCWIGYKVHLTETCEDDLPPLITHVETTAGPVADGAVTPRIHQALQAQDLLPSTHIVDTGFLDAELMVASKRDFDVDLLGPTRPDLKWQARAGQGFDAQHFEIDWEQQQATCPEGHRSLSWSPVVDNRGNQVVKVKFSSRDCRACPSRSLCCRSAKKYMRRTITVRVQDQYEALRAAREREKTKEYAAEYARRAGIEGTLSRGVRTCGLRRTRYLGEAKVHLGHLLAAAAVNFLRVSEWLLDIPRAKTRQSPFVRLMTLPA